MYGLLFNRLLSGLYGKIIFRAFFEVTVGNGVKLYSYIEDCMENQMTSFSNAQHERIGVLVCLHDCVQRRKLIDFLARCDFPLQYEKQINSYSKEFKWLKLSKKNQETSIPWDTKETNILPVQ